MISKLLSTAEAADYLKVARQTLAVWRLTGKGPVFKKIGRKVAYEISALETYLANHTYRSTSEYPQT